MTTPRAGAVESPVTLQEPIAKQFSTLTAGKDCFDASSPLLSTKAQLSVDSESPLKINKITTTTSIDTKEPSTAAAYAKAPSPPQKP